MKASSWSQEAYIKAYKFAAHAHLGQKWPGSDLPYLTHLSMVAMETMTALSTEKGREGDLAMQCSLLHDTIEDTAVSYQDVEREFGKAVADGVLALSKNENLEKKLQMPESLQRILKQPQEIWMVKMADRITNLQEPPSHWNSQKVAKYRQEATCIYEMLKEASPFLARRLQEKIEHYQLYIDCCA